MQKIVLVGTQTRRLIGLGAEVANSHFCSATCSSPKWHGKLKSVKRVAICRNFKTSSPTLGAEKPTTETDIRVEGAATVSTLLFQGEQRR